MNTRVLITGAIFSLSVYKVNNKDNRMTSCNLVLVSLLLTLNIFKIIFSSINAFNVTVLSLFLYTLKTSENHIIDQ